MTQADIAYRCFYLKGLCVHPTQQLVQMSFFDCMVGVELEKEKKTWAYIWQGLYNVYSLQ